MSKLILRESYSVIFFEGGVLLHFVGDWKKKYREIVMVHYFFVLGGFVVRWGRRER